MDYDLMDDGFVLEDEAEQFIDDTMVGLIEEDDANPVVEEDEEVLVEDDEDDEDDVPYVPGSEIPFEAKEEEPEEPEETDWAKTKRPEHFMKYLKDSLDKIPRHSGKTIPGCERALSYLKNLQNESSHAMRRDFDGVIDEIELDQILSKMQKMVDQLENHIDSLRKNAGQQQVNFISDGTCKMCNSSAPTWIDPETDEEICLACNKNQIKKEAATPILNVYMTPFERACVGTIINASIQGGKNIEEVYEHMKNKYNFSPREELSFHQLLADHGYPVGLKDRGRVNEEVDPSSGDSVEWITNYYA